MAEYTYHALPPHTIRVLNLLPDPPEAPLRGTLIDYPLTHTIPASASTNITSNSVPACNYECVSYVWGGEAKPFTILLSDSKNEDLGEDEDKYRPLPITPSLDSLLRRLRNRWLSSSEEKEEDAQMLVWADAVCINQADPLEKAQQVALMPVIYAAARRVIVDIGEESEDLDEALRLMSAWWKKHIWSGVMATTGSTALPPDDAAMLMGFDLPDHAEREVLEAVELPGRKHPSWDSVARFFDRPWFSRLWVVQEFVLAREVVMICGEREIPWREAVAASMTSVLPSRRGVGIDWLFSQVAFKTMAYQRQGRVLGQSAEGREFLGRLEGRPGETLDYHAMDLYSLLEAMQLSKATRRRDKYLALAGLAVNVSGDEPELRPDYVSPIDTIVSRFGRWFWERGSGVRVLLTGGLASQSGLQIPSWAPDFTAANARNAMNRAPIVAEHYKAAGDTVFRFTMTPGIDHLVTLSGLFVDAVDRDPSRQLPLRDLLVRIADSSVGNAGLVMPLLQHVASNLRAVFGDVPSGPPLPRQLSDEAVSAALLFGSEGGGESMTDRERAIGFRYWSWLAVYRKDLTDNEEMPTEISGRLTKIEFGAEMPEVHASEAKFRASLILTASRHSQLTPTRRGHVANLPACFERGDEIWVLGGVPLPILLRRSKVYAGCYQVIGPCYIHGMMHGEALTVPGRGFEEVTLC